MTPPAPELDALLRACKDTPSDDGPRLVLADWLDDNGEADRAEFVRCQVALARLPWYASERPDLEAQMVTAWRRGAEGWLAPLAALGLTSCTFERGLVEVSGTSAEFRKLAGATVSDDVRSAFAWVETLTVREGGLPLREYLADHWTALLSSALLGCVSGLRLLLSRLDHPLACLGRSPHVGSLRELQLRGGPAGCLTPSPVPEVASSGALAGLERLTLAVNTFTPDDYLAFARSPHFPQLRELRVGAMGRPRDDFARALAANPNSVSLTRLEWNGYGLRGEGAAALLAAPTLANLTDLHLEATTAVRGPSLADLLAGAKHLRSLKRLNVSGRLKQFPQEQIHTLTRAEHLSSLVSLDVSRCDLTPQAVAELAAAPHLPALEDLELSCNPLGDESAEALARSLALPRLKALRLCGVELGPQGIGSLGGCAALAGLRALDLSRNPLGPDGWAALAAAPYLSRLELLDLSETAPLRAGTSALGRSQLLGNLRRLFLRGNKLAVGHIRDLVKSRYPSKLAELQLNGNRLDDRALAALAKGRLGALRRLDLHGNDFSSAGVDALAAAPVLKHLAIIGQYPDGRASDPRVLGFVPGRDLLDASR